MSNNLNNKGFVIKKLILRGASVKDAVIEFKTGLNVICGPTDTGKSFIYDCIDFMMGAKELKRPIPEASSYESIFMELEILGETRSFVTLERVINGGATKLFESHFEDIQTVTPKVLGKKHVKGKKTTISGFYLDINGISGKNVRTNSNGNTISLSYRNIVHILSVFETEIIQTSSPILQGENSRKTTESNVMKFIVSGYDDSSVIPLKEKDKIIFSRKGKLELIEELIQKVDIEDNQITIDSVKQEIDKIEGSLISVQSNYDEVLNEYEVYDVKRKELSDELYVLNEDLRDVSDTLNKSALLEQHYQVDYHRLETTIEAGESFNWGSENSSICPYCNNKIADSYNNDEIATVVNSCKAESNKITNLVNELEKSVALLEKEKGEINVRITANEKDLEEVITHIEQKLTDQLKSLVITQQELHEKLNAQAYLKFQLENFSELNQLRTTLEADAEENTEVSYASLTTSAMQPVCEKMKDIFNSCNYPVASVSFHEKQLDFIIDGKGRWLSGKGFRAITHSIFVLALTEVVKTKSYSLGIPIFDSPLVTYRPENQESEADGIPLDLANSFYRYCAHNFIEGQVIILENEEPPEDIINIINYIEFTKSDSNGRYGFVPLNKD